jgi:hypothetical protein
MMDVGRAFAVTVLIASSVGVSAQGLFKPRVEKDPYRNLFAEPLRASQSAPILDTRERVPQQPAIVCGMRIIPADPTVDPRIRVTPPSDVEHTMRKVTPSVCQPK